MTTSREGLYGKTALVTGGAKRIGRAITLALAAAKSNVVVHCLRSAAEAEALVEDLRGQGVQAWVVRADLAEVRGPEMLWTQATEAAGPIDILINNASVFSEDRLPDVTIESIETNLHVHAWAPLALSRSLAAQGREGAIVNLLDARVENYDREHAAYHLSKRMLLSLTRLMALEFAPRVRVNGVAPGLILPPAGKDHEYLERQAGTNPLARYGSPELVADAVLFLLRNDFITGQVIFVDGGRHLRGVVYA